MAGLAQLQTWLAEAETRRHAVAMGTAVLDVWRDGRRVTFSQSNLSALDDYIDSLKNEIAAVEADAAGRPRRRAIGLGWAN